MRERVESRYTNSRTHAYHSIENRIWIELKWKYAWTEWASDGIILLLVIRVMHQNHRVRVHSKKKQRCRSGPIRSIDQCWLVKGCLLKIGSARAPLFISYRAFSLYSKSRSLLFFFLNTNSTMMLKSTQWVV